MEPLSQAAMTIARKRFRDELGGDIIDFPEEMRNTIANLYYSLGNIVVNTSNKFWCPESPTGNLQEALNEFFRESEFVITVVKGLPDILAVYRSPSTKDPEFLEAFSSTFLDTFKYRIPNAPNKSRIRRSLERPFYKRRVREIPDLWRHFLS